MNMWRSLFYYLGSIYLAIVLIATTALLVILGTFLESARESHGYAAAMTYGHPFFNLLLTLFFVNILFSALRRWPFQYKHIPFLITHLGLLAILAGCMIKSIVGLQGNMVLVEGSSSQEVLLPQRQVLHLENPMVRENWVLTKDWQGEWQLTPPEHPHFDVELLELVPNSRERLQLWSKDDRVLLHGMPPIALVEWSQGTRHPHRSLLHPDSEQPWTLEAFHTDSVAAVIDQLYLEGIDLLLVARADNQQLLKVPLSAALKKPVEFAGGTVKASYSLNFSPLTGVEQPHVQLTFQLKHQSEPEEILIALNGPQALLNQNTSSPELGHQEWRAELKREPKWIVINDSHDDDYVVTLDPHGCIQCDIFRPQKLESMMIYNNGYSGYGVETALPPLQDLSQRESAQRNGLLTALRNSLQHATELAPPLTLLQQACVTASKDFAETCIDFLYAWDHTHSWLYPTDVKLSPELASVMNALQLPIQHSPPTAEERARLYSAYLRAYGLHLADLMPDEQWEMPNTPPVCTLTCPVTRQAFVVPTTPHVEENLPLIAAMVKEGPHTDITTLTFDRNGAGLKWPLLSGRALARFQPATATLPYRVRLRDARQVSYPNSSQPLSYEADVLVTDIRTQKVLEATLSMNHVFETSDGYRFYLSNISPAAETAVRRVQLAVNYDPAKYWLTYPGGIILSLGILLLFVLNPYRKGRE